MAYPQARLYKSAESIGAAYEPSASAAMRELEDRSGVTVQVLAPYGGSRTDAEGWAINPYLAPWLSDHNFRKGRAIDVNNRGSIIAGLAVREGLSWAQATALYYRIWASHGWRNIQINGDPFPTEPWHLANHSSIPQSSGPIQNLKERRRMYSQMKSTTTGKFYVTTEFTYSEDIGSTEASSIKRETGFGFEQVDGPTIKAAITRCQVRRAWLKGQIPNVDQIAAAVDARLADETA